jgi:DNA-directed RNA polymerase subunit N (RpoN/RPB10)
VLKGNEGPCVLVGDPAPRQVCGLLVLTCFSCGNHIERWRPTAYAEEFGRLVILMVLRCVRCGGPIVPSVPKWAYRVPDGPVEASKC